VLEARSKAGGRALTIRGGDTETDLDGHTQRASFSPGVYFNAGPARIAQWMVTLDYCRELGVPIEVFTNINADAFIHTRAAGAPVRFRTARADVYGYVSELLAKATDQGALDAELTADDRERVLEFLQDFGALGDQAAGYRYAGGGRRGYTAYPGAGGDEGIPLPGPPSMTDVFGSGVGRYLSFDLGYDQAMPMFQPVGGMDRIPQALARAVGAAKIRLGAEVTGVKDHLWGVEVTYAQDGRARTIDAEYCISTLPPHLLARVPHNLGAPVQAALRSFPPVPAGKIGLEYRSRWWETDLRIYGGSTETELDLWHIWYPSHDYHAERGLVVGYYNVGPVAETYGRLDPAERARRAVAQGVQIHGAKYRTELASSFSVSWQRMPYLEAAWVAPPWGTPEYDLLLQPAGRVYFAGDWLSREVAWQHGAFVAARAAVTALHRRVLAA
jgi:monoamine oxidase